ncbi:MAG: alpha/beta fold hydrolase [Bacteroides sp.]|nr:alpha/beta fold hydrolase [Bacteroides sp.]
MKNVVLFLLGIVLLTGCNEKESNKEDSLLVIASQGSFMVGGKVLTHPGTFDPVNNFIPDGQTLHGDHAYVFYQTPVNARTYPLVFAHGFGQFSKTWETTPDGREGFQNIFLRRGFTTYIADQPRRGRAGRSTEAITITPAFDEQLWFNRFRVGIWPDYFEGVQFDRSEATLNQYYRQITPNTGPFDIDLYAEAYAALFDKIGPSILISHSQGGNVGWRTLLKTKNIKAIASYEPGGGLPFPEGTVTSDARTLNGKREAEEVPMEEFMEYTQIPIIIYFGDNLPETDERPELFEWTIRLRLAKEWAEVVNSYGGDVTVVHLPETGIYGNTHFPFSDLNNKEIADLLSAWLKEKKLDE